MNQLTVTEVTEEVNGVEKLTLTMEFEGGIMTGVFSIGTLSGVQAYYAMYDNFGGIIKRPKRPRN